METFDIVMLIREMKGCTFDERIKRLFRERSAAELELWGESDPTRKAAIARYARQLDLLKCSLFQSERARRQRPHKQRLGYKFRKGHP